MSSLPVLPVQQCRVLRHAIVPYHDGAFLPLHPCVEVGACGDVVVQELEDGLALFSLETDDVARN